MEITNAHLPVFISNGALPLSRLPNSIGLRTLAYPAIVLLTRTGLLTLRDGECHHRAAHCCNHYARPDALLFRKSLSFHHKQFKRNVFASNSANSMPSF
jgi:hypothetical protein